MLCYRYLPGDIVIYLLPYTPMIWAVFNGMAAGYVGRCDNRSSLKLREGMLPYGELC
jgi:hypothetical protein